MPAPQLIQPESSLAPLDVEYFPAGHSWQATEPASEYEPAGHDDPHAASDVAPDVAENFPAAHGRQTDALIAPRLEEYVPAGQGVQSADDIEGAYVPARQGTHMVPKGCDEVCINIGDSGAINQNPLNSYKQTKIFL